jgi:hypothetical protein
MRRVLLVLTLLAVPLAAQEEKKAEAAKPPVPTETRVFILKYADPESVARLFGNFIPGIIANSEMHAVAVRGTKIEVEYFADAVAKLDVPSAAARDLDFTINLVIGSDTDNPTATQYPKDLEPVISQLKGAFAFKNYRLLDVLTLRTRAGKPAQTSSAGGSVQIGSTTRMVPSQFQIGSVNVGTDGSSIHIDRMACSVEAPWEYEPGKINREHLNLKSDLDIKEGQTVVVGRMGINSQQAMFVVLTVKVVQ